jgi:hypothetical protein
MYCLTRSKRLHQESKADSTSPSRVMAAVANQVHSTAAQQIGAGSDGIRLMQQLSLQQVHVSVSLIFLIHGLIIATWASRIPVFQAHLHLSPAVLGRSLMMAAIGSVLAMPAAGWLINKFGSLSLVIGSTLGFGLALSLIRSAGRASVNSRMIYAIPEESFAS